MIKLDDRQQRSWSIHLAADSKSTQLIRLAASQRVVRAQYSDGPGQLAHFQLFGMVTAGRDTGNQSFEHQHLAEHLRFATSALAAVGARHTQIRLTALEDPVAPVIAQVPGTCRAA